MDEAATPKRDAVVTIGVVQVTERYGIVGGAMRGHSCGVLLLKIFIIIVM